MLIFVGMLTVTASTWSVSASAALNPNHLTFRAPVNLPGVTLPAGTYTFAMADTQATRNVVTVSSRDGLKRYFTGFTREVLRPANLPAGQSIVFAEGPSNVPQRIAVWYPLGQATGRQFLYDRR